MFSRTIVTKLEIRFLSDVKISSAVVHQACISLCSSWMKTGAFDKSMFKDVCTLCLMQRCVSRTRSREWAGQSPSVHNDNLLSPYHPIIIPSSSRYCDVPLSNGDCGKSFLKHEHRWKILSLTLDRVDCLLQMDTNINPVGKWCIYCISLKLKGLMSYECVSH